MLSPPLGPRDTSTGTPLPLAFRCPGIAIGSDRELESDVALADRLFVLQYGAEHVSKGLSLRGGDSRHLYWEPLLGGAGADLGRLGALRHRDEPTQP